ncbi:MAG: N-6 DNA methylase, partial [Pseudobutyrivibrio sp.]|nr:N-6 DNA methylase [Pseudobutyrivibrio sp.]
IIDYACGAGHFLTQGYEAINESVALISSKYDVDPKWAEKKIYGIEKDYRLARVSKISLFMHGAGDGNIIFGDGLENYPDKEINPETFDILVANPPYSVKAFKPHLKLKYNEFSIIDKISNEGSEIETLFVERIAQLVKSEGVAAVILPVSILNKESESFVGARESILRNFNIRAIAQFGGKTFGATGTNTVILFLEKFCEPPKRIDLVSDSINAILNAEDLSDWEDNEIFTGYLNKINVEFAEYVSFIKKEHSFSEWKNNEYFGMYYEEFISSAEYNNKKKQNSFSKLSNKEKTEWMNERFYNYVYAIEQDKLTYYALVYNQITLVIAGPDDNKKQEKFLGYKWSNRKGKEGIQIITPGGMLYDSDNRKNDDTVAGLIRNSFYGKQYDVSGLEDYSYYLRLQDMIDFSSVIFNKAIKITKMRILKTEPGYTNFKLSGKIFDVSIGDRVLSDEVREDGKYPVISANVMEEFGRIDKLNKTDFSLPSIIWGIDGDWMVNVIPADTPFYPTDHCGVIRINDSSIVPEYFATALYVEGQYERFSRNNRASTQRIKNLTIQIPQKDKQKSIVSELSEYDAKIEVINSKLEEIEETIKTQFISMFGDPVENTNGLPTSTINKVCSEVTDGAHNSPKDDGKSTIPMLSVKDMTICGFDYNDCKHISLSDYEALKHNGCQPLKNDVLLAKDGSYFKYAFVVDETIEQAILSSIAILRPDMNQILPVFLQYYLLTDRIYKMVKEEYITGMGLKRVILDDIKKIPIYVPDIKEQKLFCKYVEEKANKRASLMGQIKLLRDEKQKAIDLYFK